MAIAEDLRDDLDTKMLTAIGAPYAVISTEIKAGLWTAVGTAVTEQPWLLPAGGTAGQVLSKINATDYNTQWVAAAVVPPEFHQGDGAPASGLGAIGDHYFDYDPTGRDMYEKTGVSTWTLRSNLEPPMDERTIDPPFVINNAGATVILWATSIRNDDLDLAYLTGVFTNNTNTNKFDIYVDFNFTDEATANCQFELQLNTGGGFVTVASGVRIASVPAANLWGHCSIERRLTLAPTDAVRVIGTVIAGGPTISITHAVFRMQRV